MANFSDLYSELVGSVPRLPSTLAQKLVNRAWRNVKDMRLWSFNILTNAQIFVPNLISTGTVSATFGSTLIQADAAAIVALNTAVLGNPPLASDVLGLGRQFRVTSSPNTPTNSVYSIVAYDPNTGQLTLDRPFGETGGSLLGYMVYKCYYAMPNPNGVRYLSITNANSGYAIVRKDLYYDQERINQIDAQRGSLGDTYLLSPLQNNSQGTPVHEWYPHPTTYTTTYLASLILQLPDFAADSDTLPQVPYDLYSLVYESALALAYKWAAGMTGKEEELANTNWPFLLQQQMQQIKMNLSQCIKQDQEINPVMPFVGKYYMDLPLGGTFLQSHDLSSLIT